MSTHKVIAPFVFEGTMIGPGEVEIDFPEAMLDFLVHHGCIAAPEKWPETMRDASYGQGPWSVLPLDGPTDGEKTGQPSILEPSRSQICDFVDTMLLRARFDGTNPPSALARNLLFFQTLDRFRPDRIAAANLLAEPDEKYLKLSRVFRSLEAEGRITVDPETGKITGSGVNERLREVFGSAQKTNDLSTTWSRYIAMGGAKTVVPDERRRAERWADFYRESGLDLVDEIFEVIDSAHFRFKVRASSDVVTPGPDFSP